jgi:hypothetical protein
MNGLLALLSPEYVMPLDLPMFHHHLSIKRVVGVAAASGHVVFSVPAVSLTLTCHTTSPHAGEPAGGYTAFQKATNIFGAQSESNMMQPGGVRSALRVDSSSLSAGPPFLPPSSFLMFYVREDIWSRGFGSWGYGTAATPSYS